MNLTETLRLSAEISERLFLCTSEAEIEGVFVAGKITDIPDKIGLLRLCMGVKSYSLCSMDNELTPEQQYHDELLIFLDGFWRFLV